MRSTVIWSITARGFDAEQVLHQRALGIGERPERQRRDRAHDVLEPVDRLGDVRDGEPDVVGADEPELALADPVGRAPAQREAR